MEALPRVSDVLRLIYPNSLDHVKEYHLERGSFLHEQMEIWVNDQIYGVYGGQVISGDVLPVVRWLEKEKILFQSTEEQKTHKYGFTGRPDLLAAWNIVGNVYADYVFDYKFAESVTEQNRMQMTAYHHLTGRKCAFIQCDRKGKVKVKKYKPEPALWAVFLSGLNVWKFQQARIPKKTIEELQPLINEVRDQLCQMN